MANQDFNIAIAGAGIGGLALAIGLTHLNVPFTLYESAPAFSAVGAGVGLGPNALRAMDLIDKRFYGMYMSIATGNLNPEKKHTMMEAMRLEQGLGKGESWWGNGGWGAEYFERTSAHRKDLLDIMTSLIPSDAVRFNKTVKTITQANGRVTLTFADGQIAPHTAVICCDGVKGPSRRIVLGDKYPHLVAPVYTNRYVYRAIVPMPDARALLGDLATDAKMYMAPGANLSTYPISAGRATNVVAFRKHNAPWPHREFTHTVSREEMLDDFRHLNPDPRLMRLLDWAQPTRWALFHHPVTPTYYNGLICMMGDVAHAGGPHQGAGAGMCLEDALVLSRVLGRLYHRTNTHPSPKAVEAAFQAYDEVRRPRAQKQVLTSHECGDVYCLADPVVGADMQRVVAHLKGRFGWIWEHDLGGDVREVERRFDELAGEREGGSSRL
ncbi:FAD/NAD(P)-binding domain-containing protein [Dothidotthia symphoricarpi CBS 119687]|uniref:FAD/NAD(P)-binding domain-containing protein n=1 Tax=Dothidotthia symphoricarpi CBS 119687 TaxID=1392245 RepID=A0A6A6AT92_9PLEO|nr:FAD/NAD(P)-binding domain-containing protein [Dothidotthia symphoricarpi CBS 119687]KAF2134185.1 FAD/NAD(P)-binding domain-containing protein [Dothidotthia symphoricarpi CBS 119687]